MASEDALLAKTRVQALLGLLFACPEHGPRAVSFAQIAKVCGVPENDADLVVIRAIENKLTEGLIDGVDRVFRFTKLVPRALNPSQIEQLAAKLEAWGARVAASGDLLLQSQAASLARLSMAVRT
eukprot:gnl/Ergobibamus_cyprinoides/1008.p3 GENE.gnl/Ergobibamus_cyprinoides/1008~~gnl/Ergobibamus_cyprinoides/1008.p3  ORF type:complete len:125 (+),score=23.83 gnl/Ergobibamus_cyprinoides/1008:182-556(+)